MIKSGIYIDLENINRTGGYGCVFGELRNLVEAQDAVIVRSNAYIARDEEKEREDQSYRKKKMEFRERFRRSGFRLVQKPVKRFNDPETGEITMKANADLDLAVDALLQADNLDYVLLVSGDGDFLRLLRALQNRGKRVDVLSFGSTSHELREEADHYFPGYLFREILPMESDKDDRKRGLLHSISDNSDYGFLNYRTGYKTDAIKEDVFLHFSNLETYSGDTATVNDLSLAYKRQIPIEFSFDSDASGNPIIKNNKYKAINARILVS